MAKRNLDDDRDQSYDRKGEHGGDTGKTAPITGGEKGDQRREEPVHSGPTRKGSQSKRHAHSKRSSSDSGAA